MIIKILIEPIVKKKFIFNYKLFFKLLKNIMTQDCTHIKLNYDSLKMHVHKLNSDSPKIHVHKLNSDSTQANFTKNLTKMIYSNYIILLLCMH